MVGVSFHRGSSISDYKMSRLFFIVFVHLVIVLLLLMISLFSFEAQTAEIEVLTCTAWWHHTK